MVTEIFWLLYRRRRYKCRPLAEGRSNGTNEGWLKKMMILIITLVGIKVDAQNSNDTLHYPDEKHFENIQQLTFGGDNAEAYWSYNDERIIFQRTNPKEDVMCDRMYIGTIPQQG